MGNSTRGVTPAAATPAGRLPTGECRYWRCACKQRLWMSPPARRKRLFLRAASRLRLRVATIAAHRRPACWRCLPLWPLWPQAAPAGCQPHRPQVYYM
ncbi:hypothetical protein C4D60_Mb10t25900 [Musa balbisiana]|uniref:Uncharacterized protein n=1 Tax=Musa balbisiana TaxID=52838 RepID=A0A4S8IZW4_MUSBA|nr:hypothetical protein C4D60_Mb10t25900 [Musa balbisiana]